MKRESDVECREEWWVKSGGEVVKGAACSVQRVEWSRVLLLLVTGAAVASCCC